MTKKDFLLFMRQNNINERYYSLDGKIKDDAFHLRCNGIIWEVFYSERGKEFDNRTFNNIEDAIDYLYSVFYDGISKYGDKAFPS